MDTKNIRVTKEWLEEKYPCKRAKRDFLKRYPKGLALNRRNLYKVAEEFPISYLVWLGHITMRPLSTYWNEVYPLATNSDYRFVTSPAKKRVYAKALADALGL
jgi:hypothetical protein